MKRKICMAVLALSSGLMMAFAADVDKCTEKFESSKVTCGHQKAQATARGTTIEAANFRYKQCLADCDKELKACQAKAKSAPSAAPAKPKK